MRVGIFTQPLKQNYGGLLQNYALQQVLKKLGHEPITLDNDNWRPPFLSRISNKILYAIGIRKRQSNVFSQFVEKYITKTSGLPITFRQIRNVYRKFHFDAMIVGSDQVWRPKYTYDIRLSFLPFADCKKIAYAVSFGVDDWEFSEEETRECRNLLSDFKAVGVRELSAITLCKKHLDYKQAELVLDPTLLLDKTDYPTNESILPHKPFMFTYILDWSTFKGDIIKKVVQDRNLQEMNSLYCSDGVKKVPSLSPEEWLASIKNADFMICDSFHGIAFSIIYNIDFIALLNPERGNTRIESILELFNLSDRIVKSANDLDNLSDINWDLVNSQRGKLIDYSINFLRKAIDN